MIGRPTYREAVQWIADNDAPADDDVPENLQGYLTVCLVADLFGRSQFIVAQDVYNARLAVK